MNVDETSRRESSAGVFSSAREKRLWSYTFIVVAGIYSTLGLASSLASSLYNQGLSAIVFVTCMALVAIAVMTQGLRARPGRLEFGVGIGIAAVYIMVFLRLTIPERSHLIEYGIVALLVCESLIERKMQGKRVPLLPFVAILLTTIVGAVDEFIQLLLPSRHFEWQDLLFNFLAATLAVGSLMILRWARKTGDRILGK